MGVRIGGGPFWASESEGYYSNIDKKIDSKESKFETSPFAIYAVSAASVSPKPPICEGVKLPNPDPNNFNILRLFAVKNTYLEIQYPDATNYEGVKILVFEGNVTEQILDSDYIDPHFKYRLPNTLSPIARFEPSVLGRKIAMELIKKDLTCL